MQYVSAEPLINQFQRGIYKDEEAGSYFMAHMILTSIVMSCIYLEYSFIEMFLGLISVIITIFGVLYLKKKNNDSYGNQFLVKYMALGWVVGVRLLLIAVPVIVLISVLEAFFPRISDSLYCGFTIFIELGFYWWLGRLIAKSNEPVEQKAGVLPPLS